MGLNEDDQEFKIFFFKYAKNKMLLRAPISPFTKDKGKVINNTFNKTYFEVYKEPNRTLSH